MEPNQNEVQVEQVSIVDKIKKIPVRLILSIFIVILCVGGIFAYIYVYTPWHKAKLTEEALKIKQTRILAIEEKIKKAGGSSVDLTAEEYELLLTETITNPDIEGIKGKAQEINVAYDSGNYDGSFSIALPYLPNIEGKEKVFVRIDSILTNDGTDIFDKESGFEDENDMFTDIEIEKRNNEGKLYLVGSRDVNLNKEGFKNDEIQKVSGRVILNLPVNSQSLSLSIADVGIEKQFIGGFLTLNEIKNDEVTFTFVGNDKLLNSPEGYDKDGKKVSRYMYSYGDNEKYVQFSEPVSSVTFSGSGSILTKEYPFVIINNNLKSVANIEPVKMTPMDPEVPAIAESDVTDQDKKLVIAAYFDFEKVLNSKTPIALIEYIKKAHPESAEALQKEYEKDPNPKDFDEIVSMMKDFLGYGLVTVEKFNQTSTVWTKTYNKISVEISFKDKEGYSDELELPFVKENNVWYVDFGK